MASNNVGDFHLMSDELISHMDAQSRASMRAQDDAFVEALFAVHPERATGPITTPGTEKPRSMSPAVPVGGSSMGY